MAYFMHCFRLPLQRCCGCHYISKIPFTVRNISKTIQPIRQFATKYQHDITLYKYERGTFFKVLAVASLSQLVFWSYMSYVMYVYIRPASQMLQDYNARTSLNNLENINQFRYFPKFLLTSKAQTMVSIASLGMGVLFLFTGCAYALRSVNQIILLRNGSRIFVRTYNPVGGMKQISAPLSDVSCLGSRLDEKSFVVLKIRNRRFYYMVDKRGDFLQPTLFDTTVGVRR